MYKIIILIFSLCIYSTSTIAAEPATTHLRIPNSIHHIAPKLEAITHTIIPLTFDAHQYAKPESKVILQKSLADLLLILKSAPEPFSKPSVSFKASFPVMFDHIEHTQKALEHKNYAKAQEMLKAIPALFIACHIPIDLHRGQFASDFDFAEFNYLIQNYQNSITYYDKYLTSKGHHQSQANTQLALERLLTIYAQIDKDPALATTYLHEYIPYLTEHLELKSLLQQWIVELQNLNEYFDEGSYTHRPIAFASIQNYVASFLFSNINARTPVQPSEKVKLIVLRGMLFDYLNESAPSDQKKPMLLYWLALCDRKLNDGAYSTSADIFLAECFTTYPQHAYAELCKQAFNRDIQTAAMSPMTPPV